MNADEGQSTTAAPARLARATIGSSNASPASRMTLVLGAPGSGKTTLALQILVNGARRGERGLFVSFAKTHGTLFESAARFGWDLAEMEKQGVVLLLRRKPPSLAKPGRPALDRALEVLRTKAAALGAQRIILDSLDAWLPSTHHPMTALEELYRIRDWLFENQFTGLVTAGLAGLPLTPAQALMPLPADCTILLRENQAGEHGTRHLLLAKRRGWASVEEELPFVIGPKGIELLVPRRSAGGQASAGLKLAPPEIVQARQELLTEVQSLDRFLELKQAELDFRLAKQALSAI